MIENEQALITNKELKKRILEISYNNRLSHLGSCLTAVDIIYEIYQQKRAEEKFVLSSGHAGLALYTVLEAMGGRNAEEIFKHHGVHPDRCRDCGIDCSTGSLGQGLPIAVGMALAKRDRNVYCLISDGECAEGSIWEGLRIKEEQRLENLKLYFNINGWGAYQRIDSLLLKRRLWEAGILGEIRETTVEQLPFLKGQNAHYKVMDEEDYKEALTWLK